MKRGLKILIFGVLVFAAVGSGFSQDPEYKIVFPTEYEGKRYSVGQEESDTITRERRKILNQELNYWGERGYRYRIGTPGSTVLVVLDEGKYEYDWWRVDSSSRFGIATLAEKVKVMNENGFRVIDHFMDRPVCEDHFEDAPYLGEACQYAHTFIFERQKDSKFAPKQLITGSIPAWGAKPGKEMAGGIDAQLAEGFYPAMAITNFDILLEQIKDKLDILDDRPDVKVVRSQWSRGDLKRKVAAAAKQGYRITETTKGMAVMYRNSSTEGIPVEYEWLEAKKKNLEKQLEKLSRNSLLRYSDTYFDWTAGTDILVFEVDSNVKGVSSDLKLIPVDTTIREYTAKAVVTQTLSSSGEKAMESVNSLAQEGYLPRELFYRNGILNVLLEKLP